VLSKGAGEDGLFEGFWFQTGVGAGAVGVRVSSGRVGGQVALTGPHLMDSSCHDLVHAHEGPRVHGEEVMVAAWRCKEASPLIAEGSPYSFLEGRVHVVHQGLRESGQGWGDKV